VTKRATSYTPSEKFPRFRKVSDPSLSLHAKSEERTVKSEEWSHPHACAMHIEPRAASRLHLARDPAEMFWQLDRQATPLLQMGHVPSLSPNAKSEERTVKSEEC
jgi:hypothetical protein